MYPHTDIFIYMNVSGCGCVCVWYENKRFGVYPERRALIILAVVAVAVVMVGGGNGVV